MLTFPLAFPGVVVGFMIILLAGRQGLIGEVTNRIFGEKLVFAYSIGGLFLGYLYFSIPRVILTIMAAVEKLDPELEEAARSLGAGPWAVHRDVICRRCARPSSPPVRSHLQLRWEPSAPLSRSRPISTCCRC